MGVYGNIISVVRFKLEKRRSSRNHTINHNITEEDMAIIVLENARDM